MKLFSGDDKGKIVYSSLDLDQVNHFQKYCWSDTWRNYSWSICILESCPIFSGCAGQLWDLSSPARD